MCMYLTFVRLGTTLCFWINDSGLFACTCISLTVLSRNYFIIVTVLSRNYFIIVTVLSRNYFTKFILI